MVSFVLPYPLCPYGKTGCVNGSRSIEASFGTATLEHLPCAQLRKKGRTLCPALSKKAQGKAQLYFTKSASTEAVTATSSPSALPNMAGPFTPKSALLSVVLISQPES